MLPVFINDDRADARLRHQRTDAPNFQSDERCQTFGGFVQQQQVGVGHEGPTDAEHLLFTTTQLLTTVAQAFTQTGEGVQHTLVGPVLLTTYTWAGSHHQVFMHAQVAKDASTFGHIGHALMGDGEGCLALNGLALKFNLSTAGLDQTNDAFQQRGFAHAIATHEAHGFAAPHLE